MLAVHYREAQPSPALVVFLFGVFEAGALNQKRYRLDASFCFVVVSFGPEHVARFRVSCPTVNSPAPRANINSPTFTAIIGFPGLRIRIA